MSPIVVIALLCTLALSGATAAISAKAKVDIDTDPSRLEILTEKVAEFLGKAKSELQEKCILEIAAKPVVKAKVLGLGLDLTKTVDDVKEKVGGLVDTLTKDQKSLVKGKAVSWLKQQEDALGKCLKL